MSTAQIIRKPLAVSYGAGTALFRGAAAVGGQVLVEGVADVNRLQFVRNDDGADVAHVSGWSKTTGGTYVEVARVAMATRSASSGAGEIALQVKAPAGALTTTLMLDEKLSVVLGAGALATTATDGFVYMPTAPGTPSGAPTAHTGRAPVLVDSAANTMWFYSGGSWRQVGGSLPNVGPGAGLYGGNGIASVTLDAQGRVTAIATATYALASALSGYVPTTRTLTAGAGLTGLGDLAADRSVAIATAGVTSAMLRDSAALSVIGRSANSVGVPADIVGANDQFLRVRSSVLGFGSIVDADLPATIARTSALALGASQIAYGTGTGITSQTTFLWSATNKFLAINSTATKVAGFGAAGFTCTGDTDQVVWEARRSPAGGAADAILSFVGINGSSLITSISYEMDAAADAGKVGIWTRATGAGGVVKRIDVRSTGSVIIGSGLAQSATDGFLYINGNATGAPTGTPTAVSSGYPITCGGAGFFWYASGAWRQAAEVGSVAPVGAQYLALAADSTLTNERVLTVGAGLSSADAGAGGAFTISMPNVGPGAGLVGGNGIASVTLDAQGRVTAVGTATYALSSALSGYVPTTRAVNTTGGLQGGGALSGDLSLSIATAGVTSAMLRNSTALSVIGRSANSAGVPADIAGTNDQFLRVRSSVLGFGSILDTDLPGTIMRTSALSIAAGQVAYATGANVLGGASGLTWDATNATLKLGGTVGDPTALNRFRLMAYDGGTAAGSYGFGVENNNLWAHAGSAVGGLKFYVAGTRVAAFSGRDTNLNLQISTYGTCYFQADGGLELCEFALSTPTNVTRTIRLENRTPGSNPTGATEMQFGTGGAPAMCLSNSRLVFRSSTGAGGTAALFSNGSFGGGDGVLSIANRTTAPTSAPSGGGIQYTDAGSQMWLGSSGVYTVVAP